MVRIRLATREDMESLFALDQACFRPGIAYSLAELRYFLFHPRSISLVAEEESDLAGFAIAKISAVSGKRFGHIVTIDVVSARRKQGVGRKLMNALIEACRAEGALSMRLEVAVDNDGALEFYRLLGFTETGRIRAFYMGKLDALRMEKDWPSSHTSFARS
ncbi:MAG: N-acetyltransferase [Silvibacterium sp.]